MKKHFLQQIEIHEELTPYAHPSAKTTALKLCQAAAAQSGGFHIDELASFVERLDRQFERILILLDTDNSLVVDFIKKQGFQFATEKKSLMLLDIRKAARALIFNPKNEILLMQMKADWTKEDQRGFDAFWLTPGGKIEAGEDEELALLREIYEETGLRNVELQGHVFSDERTAIWDGLSIRLFNHYYHVTARDIDISKEYLEEYEKEIVLDYRWWSLKELAETNELIFPNNLIEKLQALQLSRQS